MNSDFRHWFVGNLRSIKDVEVYWNKKIEPEPMTKGQYEKRKHEIRKLWYDEYGYNKDAFADIEWFMRNKKKPTIMKPADTRDWITDEQLKELINACRSNKQKLFIEFIASTGWRIGEVTGLKRSQIQKLRGGFYLIKSFATKTQTNISAIITSDLYIRIIKEFGNKSTYLFSTSSGKPYFTSYISNQIKKIGKTINLDISAHTIRHYWVCKQVDSGKSIHEISRAIGHSTPGSTVNSYYHENIKEKT